MTEAITAPQLLDFLAKADKVSSSVTVKKEMDFYEISIYADWGENNHFYSQTTCITEDGRASSWKNCDYEFFTMTCELDYLVKKEEEREIKRQKRQELLSRLTDEEKELLGLS